RDWSVTGVQTCALPIYAGGQVHRHTPGVTFVAEGLRENGQALGRGLALFLREIRILSELFERSRMHRLTAFHGEVMLDGAQAERSEERRVGKGWRETRW